VAATNTDIHASRFACPRGRSNSCSCKTEKFGLQLEREVPDFVEKKRTAVGEFEAADFLSDGASKRAFSWRRGSDSTTRSDGGTIDFNEGAIAARLRLWMARARVPCPCPVSAKGEGPSCPRARELHLGQGALQRRAFADNFLEIEFTANFFLR